MAAHCSQGSQANAAKQGRALELLNLKTRLQKIIVLARKKWPSLPSEAPSIK
jgi:hypothetical protein